MFNSVISYDTFITIHSYLLDLFRKGIFELSDPGLWEECHTYHRNRFC